MSSVIVAPKTDATLPLLFFGCLNGAIFVHLDKEATPLNVLTFHSQNGNSPRLSLDFPASNF